MIERIKKLLLNVTIIKNLLKFNLFLSFFPTLQPVDSLTKEVLTSISGGEVRVLFAQAHLSKVAATPQPNYLPGCFRSGRHTSLDEARLRPG